MNHPQQEYYLKSIDWRNITRRNHIRFILLLITFVLLYVGIGVIFDICSYTSIFPNLTIVNVFLQLITFQLPPQFSKAFLIIGLFFIAFILLFHRHILLLGLATKKIDSLNKENFDEKKLLNIMNEMTIVSQLNYRPDVYLIEEDYINLFSSGYSKNSSFIAITRGAVKKLNREELEAVIAHEIIHLIYQDAKLTLMASTLAYAFQAGLYALTSTIFYLIGKSYQEEEKEDSSARESALFLLTLGLLASIFLHVAIYLLLLIIFYPPIKFLLLKFLNNSREQLADAGVIKLTRNNQALSSALLKIKSDYDKNFPPYLFRLTIPETLRRYIYFYDPHEKTEGSSFMQKLIAFRPSVEERLKMIGFIKIKD